MKNENKMGRPTKLTQEIQDEIVELLKAANYIGTACAVVGVGRSTYYDWIRKADESSRSNKYTRFRDAVQKALAYGEARLVAIISKQAEEKWQAAAWLLERSKSEKWGRNPDTHHKSEDRDDSEGPSKSPQQVSGDISHIDPADLEIIKRVLDEMAREPPKI